MTLEDRQALLDIYSRRSQRAAEALSCPRNALLTTWAHGVQGAVTLRNGEGEWGTLVDLTPLPPTLDMRHKAGGKGPSLGQELLEAFGPHLSPLTAQVTADPLEEDLLGPFSPVPSTLSSVNPNGDLLLFLDEGEDTAMDTKTQESEPSGSTENLETGADESDSDSDSSGTLCDSDSDKDTVIFIPNNA